MRNNKTISIAFLLVVVLVTSAVLMCACNNNDLPKESFNVTYNLNYDDNDTRVYPVQSGVTAPEWKPAREGYNLDFWTTDEAGTQRYDFSQKVYSDLNLYAVWKVKPGKVNVTFDFGYAGATNKQVAVDEGGLVSTKSKPTHERFGMELVGWFKEATFNTEWDFDADVVNEDTTLYAKWRYTMNIARDENGVVSDSVFENTEVYLWVDDNAACDDAVMSVLNQMATSFNTLYSGKIKVTVSKKLTAQKDVMLRLQQTPELLKNYKTYHPVADMMTFAGLDFSNDDFYEGASNECKYKGVLIQTPLGASVPYLVYNKNLMTKYNGDNALPSNYSEFSALLKKAKQGEASNSNFNSFIASSQWSFKEAPSYIAFAQNNAPYYSYVNGTYRNTWDDESVMSSAVNALTIMHDLLGTTGTSGGKMLDVGGSNAYSTVNSGNALFGMQSWVGNEATIANNSKLGVMSLAGLFSDSTEEYANRVPVHGFGLGFYNGAKNVTSSPVKVCAAAKFVQYVLENSWMFAKKGYAPLYKQATNNENYINSTDKTTQLVRSACNPEHFFTLPGGGNLKNIVNKYAAEGFIMPFLTSKTSQASNAEEKVRALYSQIGGLVS